MDQQAVATWVIAGTGILYTVGTFLLWRTTRRSVDLARDAFRLNFLLACRDTESGTGLMGGVRLAIKMTDGDPAVAAHGREQKRSHMLNELLIRNFPEEYESLTGKKAQAPASPPK